MAYRSHRRRRARPVLFSLALVVVAGGVGTWWYLRPKPKAATLPQTESRRGATAQEQWHSERQPAPLVEKPASRPAEVVLAPQEQIIIPAAATSQPAEPLDAEAHAGPNEAQSPAGDPAVARSGGETRSGNAAIEAARKLLDAGQVIEARHQLNALLKGNPTDADSAEVRSLLTRIADDTIFGRRTVPGDPLVETYTVESGDVLVNIGRKYEVPAEVLMEVNGIADATKIRMGQKFKVPRGPFHVKIYKSKFRLDVYLQELYVRSFRVGLGSENGTPEGVWKVKNRLENPTYYPPASATDKRIIPPDDPNNPLGGRWIGLEGVEGDAAGHEGYGIHGTIDPESIGKSVSLGCVRMHNDDVTFLYKLVLPGRSTVTILP